MQTQTANAIFEVISDRKYKKQNSDTITSCSGFSLLEVLVCLSIISIVLISIYRLHSQTLMMNYSAQFNTKAPLLAQTKLAELDLMTENDLSDGSGDFGDDFPGYTWKVTITDLDHQEDKSFPGSLKRVEIKISLNNDEDFYNLTVCRFVEDE